MSSIVKTQHAGEFDCFAYEKLQKDWVDQHPKVLQVERELKACEVPVPFDPDVRTFLKKTQEAGDRKEELEADLSATRGSLALEFDLELGRLPYDGPRPKKL